MYNDVHWLVCSCKKTKTIQMCIKTEMIKSTMVPANMKKNEADPHVLTGEAVHIAFGIKRVVECHLILRRHLWIIHAYACIRLHLSWKCQEREEKLSLWSYFCGEWRFSWEVFTFRFVTPLPSDTFTSQLLGWRHTGPHTAKSTDFTKLVQKSHATGKKSTHKQRSTQIINKL